VKWSVPSMERRDEDGPWLCHVAHTESKPIINSGQLKDSFQSCLT
jgi:hypothetical protein